MHCTCSFRQGFLQDIQFWTSVGFNTNFKVASEKKKIKKNCKIGKLQR